MLVAGCSVGSESGESHAEAGEFILAGDAVPLSENKMAFQISGQGTATITVHVTEESKAIVPIGVVMMLVPDVELGAVDPRLYALQSDHNDRLQSYMNGRYGVRARTSVGDCSLQLEGNGGSDMFLVWNDVWPNHDDTRDVEIEIFDRGVGDPRNHLSWLGLTASEVESLGLKSATDGVTSPRFKLLLSPPAADYVKAYPQLMCAN